MFPRFEKISSFLRPWQADCQYSLMSGTSNQSHGDLHFASSIISATKPFTAAGILSKNNVKLDDPITQYLNLSKNFEYVLVSDLLNQTSGFREYLYDFPIDQLKAMSLDDICSEISKMPLGERGDFHYCNSNYVFLSRIIEVSSELSFGQFMEKTFFSPLSLNRTKVMSHTQNDFWGWGDANITSTVSDLQKWLTSQTFIEYMQKVIDINGRNVAGYLAGLFSNGKGGVSLGFKARIFEFYLG